MNMCLFILDELLITKGTATSIAERQDRDKNMTLACHRILTSCLTGKETNYRREHQSEHWGQRQDRDQIYKDQICQGCDQRPLTLFQKVLTCFAAALLNSER